MKCDTAPNTKLMPADCERECDAITGCIGYYYKRSRSCANQKMLSTKRVAEKTHPRTHALSCVLSHSFD